MKKVGILGGMGPEATVVLMQKIIENTDALGDHEHVPLLVDNNTQVPSRIDFIIKKTGLDPMPILCSMATSLEKSGVEALAMPRNTAHAFIKEIRTKISIPFISIIDETIFRLSEIGMQKKRIGILASPAVQITKIFEHELDENNLDVVYIGKDELLLRLIHEVKANKQAQCFALEEIVSKCDVKKIDILLIACSEFSIISDLVRKKFAVPVLDTLDLLANKIIKFSKEK